MLFRSIECIGDISRENVSEVVKLAALSLAEISKDSVLEISHLGVVSSILEKLDISEEVKGGILRCVNEKNTDTLDSICKEESIDPDICEALKGLTLLYAPCSAAVGELRSIIAPIVDGNEELQESFNELSDLISDLSDEEIADLLKVDFSVTTDLKYYKIGRAHV